MRIGLDRPQIIDRHDLQILASGLDDRTQHEAANPAKSVDRDADRHTSIPFFSIKWTGSDSDANRQTGLRESGFSRLPDTPVSVAQTSANAGKNLCFHLGFGRIFPLS